jgi:hypothetical protein
MTTKVIVDAGPILNFFSTRKERVLLGALGPISAPGTVADEVQRKARSDSRFAPAAAVWAKLEGTKWLEVLSDDITPQLSEAVERISNLPMTQRFRRAKDLGEIMVISHAATHSDVGADVIIVIDDGAGARLATAEISRVRRQKEQGGSLGEILLVNTCTVLERAAGGPHIPDRNTMRIIYEHMRARDDGLLDINQTTLMSKATWERP